MVGLGRLWSPSSGVVSFRHSFLAFRVSVSPVLQPPAPWSLGSSVTSAPTGPPERTEVGGDKGWRRKPVSRQHPRVKEAERVIGKEWQWWWRMKLDRCNLCPTVVISCHNPRLVVSSVYAPLFLLPLCHSCRALLTLVTPLVPLRLRLRSITSGGNSIVRRGPVGWWWDREG